MFGERIEAHGFANTITVWRARQSCRMTATCITFIVLYCIVLYCIVLHCIALHCIALYCIVLYCIVLYCIVLYCIVLYCIVLYCIVLYCIVLYCIVTAASFPDARYITWHVMEMQHMLPYDAKMVLLVDTHLCRHRPGI